MLRALLGSLTSSLYLRLVPWAAFCRRFASRSKIVKIVCTQGSDIRGQWLQLIWS
jgi:hypothetical protein